MYNKKNIKHLTSPTSRHSIPSSQTPTHKSQSYFAKLKERQQQITQILVSKKSPEEKTEKFPDSKNLNTTTESNILIIPEDEQILNTVRNQSPKAELKNSPLFHTARIYSSLKSNISEQCEEYEEDLKIQRVKYRKLENQYNELLNKNKEVEDSYKSLSKELARKMNGFQRSEEDELIEEIVDIKKSLKEILRRVDGVTQRIKTLN